MTHRLRERDPRSPWRDPLVAQMRFECSCVGGTTVVDHQTVMDVMTPEEMFLAVTRLMIDDVRRDFLLHVESRTHTCCAERSRPAGAWRNIVIVTLRYRCACEAREVLQINVALEPDVEDPKFGMTMKQLWRDLQQEVRQHAGRIR
jgi:hypothetical protein